MMEKVVFAEVPIFFDDEWNVNIDEDKIDTLRRNMAANGLLPAVSDIEIQGTIAYNIAVVFSYYTGLDNLPYKIIGLSEIIWIQNILVQTIKRLRTTVMIKNPKMFFDFFVDWVVEREDSIVKMYNNHINVNTVLIERFTETLNQIFGNKETEE